jgi:peroxiredoxin Q/BCP
MPKTITPAKRSEQASNLEVKSGAARPSQKPIKKAVKKTVKKTVQKVSRQASETATRKVTEHIAESVTKKAGKKTTRKVPPKSVAAGTAVTAATAKRTSVRGAHAATSKKQQSRGQGLLEVGAPLPDFKAQDASGMTQTLASIRKAQNGKPFVLYFYPQDDTPGCTVEACDFRDLRPKFSKLGCAVFGVSPDSIDSHRAFDAKYKLGFTLLADARDAEGVPAMASAFGVWQEKNMYGKKYMGIVRTTYIIAGDGKVAARFDRVKVDGHAEEVLAVLTQCVRA